MVWRLSKELGVWPHQLAVKPLHYYRAMRDSFIRANTPRQKNSDDDIEIEAFNDG